MTNVADPETDAKSRGSRRGNRQGSVYYVKSKDRYRATLDGLSKDFLTRGEADDHLRRALNQREHGAPAVANRQSLSAYLDQWLARRLARREIAVTTAQGYEGYIRVHIRGSKFGKRRLDAHGWPTAIDEFLTAKLRSGLSLRTVEQIHAILRKAFADAKRAGLIGFNPATTEYVAAVHPVRMPPTVLSLEQTERLMAEARGNRYEHLFMFLLATGARLGEARGLRWHDFDGRTPLVDLERRRVILKNTVITLKGSSRIEKGRSWDWKVLTKGKQAPIVPLPPHALEALRLQQVRVRELREKAGSAWQDLDLVFPSAVGTPFDSTNALHEFQKLCDRAGIPVVNLHSARHTSASNDLAAGTDPRVVMAKHGWSQLSMLERYQHVTDALLEEAAQRVAPLLPRNYRSLADGGTVRE